MGYEKKCMLFFCGAVGGAARFNFKIAVMGVGSDETIFPGRRVGWSARSDFVILAAASMEPEIILPAAKSYMTFGKITGKQGENGVDHAHL